MRKHTFQLDVRKIRDFCRLIRIVLRHLEADPRHAGIDREVCFCFPVLACCLFFEGKCLCVAVDRLSDVVFHKVAVLGRGHVAENQDRRGNAVFSELDSLLDGCGCKIINLVFQIGCYRNGAVAVGIRFYNAKEFHTLRQSFFHFSDVMPDRFE